MRMRMRMRMRIRIRIPRGAGPRRQAIVNLATTISHGLPSAHEAMVRGRQTGAGALTCAPPSMHVPLPALTGSGAAVGQSTSRHQADSSDFRLAHGGRRELHVTSRRVTSAAC
ncbi:hypothetical protein GCM10010103_72060 [Streptomyces paradoxus]